MRGELQFRLEIPSEPTAERQHDRKPTQEPLPVAIVVLALVVTYIVARGASGMKIMPGTHLYFGAQTTGSVGHVVPIRLTTRDRSVLGISNVAVMGSGFDVDANACTSGRDADECMISVQFHPLIEGSQKAVLTINRKGSSGPRQVTLSGVGISRPPVDPNVAGPMPPPAGPNVVRPVSTPPAGPNVARPFPPSGGPNVVSPVSPPPAGPTVTGSNWSPPGLANPPPDYALFASPADITVVQGSSGTSTIMVRRQQGFRGNVHLSVTGVPDGVKTSFTQDGGKASFTQARPADTSTLTLYVPPAPAPGTEFATLVNPGKYPLVITGTSGNLTHSTRVVLTVNASLALPSRSMKHLEVKPNVILSPPSGPAAVSAAVEKPSTKHSVTKKTTSNSVTLPTRAVTQIEVKPTVNLSAPSIPAAVSKVPEKRMRPPTGEYRTASPSKPATDEKSRKNKHIPTKNLPRKSPPPPQ